MAILDVSTGRVLKKNDPGYSTLKAQQNRARGKCGCGRTPEPPGAKQCLACKASQKRLRDRRSGSGLCQICEQPAPSGIYCLLHKKVWRQRDAEYKAAAIRAYGGKCACPNCPESDPAFLTIDHVNNDGAKHRKEMRGNHLYKWLKDHNYPSGFQVLCMNCNCGKQWYGHCPHERSTRLTELYVAGPTLGS